MVTKIKNADAIFEATRKNETFLVEATTDLEFVNVSVGINGSGKAGGRTIRVDGTVNAPFEASNAIQMDCSTKTVERIVIGSTGDVSATIAGIATGTGGQIDIRVAGDIQGDVSAIAFSTDAATLKNTGRIEGGEFAGLNLLHGALTVRNAGDIIAATGFAIHADGDKCTVVNTGSIEKVDMGTAIGVAQGDFNLTNTGTISAENGTSISIGGAGSAVGAVTIVNEGTVTGLANAIFAGTVPSSGLYTVINTGEIIGNIDLARSDHGDIVNTSNGRVEGDIRTGGGNDRIALVNAIVTGTVAGGEGDDIYSVSSNGIVITEIIDGGIDTIRATGNVSITLATNFENITLFGKTDTQATGNGVGNVITGNAGNNIIDGAAGEDIIRGGKGRDELIGGADVDTFIFRAGDGKDLIGDFDTGGNHDFLDLSSIKGIKDFDDLVDNHASDVGGDVVIHAGKGDVVVLEGLTVAELRAELFFL